MTREAFAAKDGEAIVPFIQRQKAGMAAEQLADAAESKAVEATRQDQGRP